MTEQDELSGPEGEVSREGAKPPSVSAEVALSDAPPRLVPQPAECEGPSASPRDMAPSKATPSESSNRSASLPWQEAVAVIKDHLTTEVARLEAAFADKLAYDRFKEEQITRLHDELKAYKSDLLYETLKPLVNGLIRIHDDMGKVIDSAGESGQGHEDRVRLAILGFQEDVEILLGEVDVHAYAEDGDEFNPRRQQATQTEPAPEPSSIGRVARHLRRGFERGERVIRKERVCVYVVAVPGETPGAETRA